MTIRDSLVPYQAAARSLSQPIRTPPSVPKTIDDFSSIQT